MILHDLTLKKNFVNMLSLIILINLIQNVNAALYQSGSLQQVIFTASPLHILADTHAADSSITITQALTGFTADPQVLYSVYKMHFENGASGGYTFSITAQSITGFSIQIIAPTVQKIYDVWMRWLAFVDRSKQIITEEIINPDASESFSEIHYNKNFVMAVPIVNYLSYSSQFSYKFSTASVSTTQVTITLTTTGLSQIGFQILLSVKSPVYLYGVQEWTPTTSLNAQPFVVTGASVPNLQQSDNLKFPIFMGFSSSLTDTVNIEEMSSSATSSLSFQIGSSISCSVTQGWFDYMLISPQFQVPPLLLSTFTQEEYYDTAATQPITVELVQFQLTYTANTDWMEVDNTYLGLQLAIKTECKFKYKHDYWFLGSVGDNQKYIQDFFYCSDNFNRMKYNINFNDGQRLEYKYIKILFTATSVEIYQQLDNINFDEEYRLLKIVISKAR